MYTISESDRNKFRDKVSSSATPSSFSVDRFKSLVPPDIQHMRTDIPFTPPDLSKSILDGLNEINGKCDEMCAKKQWDFQIERNKSGLIVNIIATEL